MSSTVCAWSWRFAALLASAAAVVLALLGWRPAPVVPVERPATHGMSAPKIVRPPVAVSPVERAAPAPLPEPPLVLDAPAQLEVLERRFAEAHDPELVAIAGEVARLGGKDARGFLMRAARSPRAAAREAALVALGTLDTADVRAFMVSELGSSSPNAALAYFADCLEPAALPALEELARTADAEHRSQALTALVAQGPAGHAAISRLLRGEDDVADLVLSIAKEDLALRPTLRASAIARLREGAITNGAVFDYLGQDLSAEGRDALAAAGRDDATTTAVASALVARGDPASRAALETLSHDSNPRVAALALCGLFRDVDSRDYLALMRERRAEAELAVSAALKSIHAID